MPTPDTDKGAGDEATDAMVHVILLLAQICGGDVGEFVRAARDGYGPGQVRSAQHKTAP
jgi:hypothetical protein